MTDYQKHRDIFNSMLNEKGAYSIGLNFTRNPSEILLAMDPAAYNAQLIEYVDQIKSEYEDTVYHYLPAPIAFFLYQTNHGYDNANERLHLLRSTWESVIYVLYALILGEVNNINFSLTPIRIFNNQRISLNGLLNDRLQYKIELMRKVIDYDKQNNNDLFLSSVLSNNVFDLLEELNNKRNSFSHIASLPEIEAKERLDELYPKTMDLLFELNFLENVSLLRYVSNPGSITNVRFNKYDGHSLQRQNIEQAYTAAQITPLLPLLSDSYILFELNGIIINTSPFIHFSLEGAQLKICYFKSKDRTSGEFLFEKIGATNRDVKIPEFNLNNCIHTTLQKLI